MTTLIIFALMCGTAAADMLLVSFDGNVNTTFNFTEHDNVPGPRASFKFTEHGNIPGSHAAVTWKAPESNPEGFAPACASSGTWDVTNGHGVLDADIRVEWDCFHAGWPGFIRATAVGQFVDASAAFGGSLVLMVRSNSPEYTGFQVSFGTTEHWKTTKRACSGELGPYKPRGCYIASFTVPAGGDFVSVRIPFSSFSDMWLYGPNAAFKTCAEDKEACPTAQTLANIQQIDLWAAGVKGKAHLEVKSIAASSKEVDASRIDHLQSAVV